MRDFPNAQCVWGFILSSDPTHFHNCLHLSKWPRHKQVMDRLIQMAKACGVLVLETEHNLANGLRTDATFQFPHLAKNIQVDAAIVHSAAGSYTKLDSTHPLRAANIKHGSKVDKYKVAVEEEGDVFFPMVWESTGASTRTVKRLLQLFVETADKSMKSDPPSLKYMLDFINGGIQEENAKLSTRGLTLMTRHLIQSNKAGGI